MALKYDEFGNPIFETSGTNVPRDVRYQFPTPSDKDLGVSRPDIGVLDYLFNVDQAKNRMAHYEVAKQRAQTEYVNRASQPMFQPQPTAPQSIFAPPAPTQAPAVSGVPPIQGGRTYGIGEGTVTVPPPQTLPGGGQASTIPGAIAPIEGGQTFQVGRGTVTLPEGARAPTSSLEAQMRQDWLRETAGARMASRNVISALREQGMTDEQIQERAGLTPQMSATESYRRLTELNNGRATGTTAQADRVWSRIGEKSEISSEGVPNQYSRAEQMRSSLDERVAMPTIDKPDNTVSLNDYIEPKYKREYDRYVNNLSRGIKSAKDEKRLISAMAAAKVAMNNDIQNNRASYDAEVKIRELRNDAAKAKAQDYKNQSDAIDDKLNQTSAAWGALEEMQLKGGKGWDNLTEDGYVKNPINAEQRKYNGLKAKRDKLIEQKDKLTNDMYGIFEKEGAVGLQSNVAGSSVDDVIGRFMDANPGFTIEQAIEEAKKAGRLK